MTSELGSGGRSRDAFIIRVGGVSLIVGAVAFVAVFSYLATRFNYPDVLDGRAADVLPALLATGTTGRAVWAIYALLPLLWIPSSIGAFHALRARSEGLARMGMHLAAISSLAMVLGLMRWPGMHWVLAQAWVADAGVRPALDVQFNAANLYLGNYIGEFLGESCFSAFFLLAAIAMLKHDSGFPRWVGWAGAITAVLGAVGMFRNVTEVVAPVADINNLLLPLWMIVFGISLLQYAKSSHASLIAQPTAAPD